MKKSVIYYLLLFIFISMSETSFAQDWANLAKYETQNNQLPPKQSGEKRIVLMGDSITEFWSQLQPEFFTNTTYINRGISGQTTPDVVVILAGVNDIAGNTGPTTNDAIFGNIISMVELAKANAIKVILCSVLPANNFYWRPNEKAAETIIQLNQLIQSYAKEHDIPYVDYHSAMADAKNGLPKEFSEDSVHPNLKGYQTMQPLLEKAVQKLY